MTTTVWSVGRVLTRHEDPEEKVLEELTSEVGFVMVYQDSCLHHYYTRDGGGPWKRVDRCLPAA